MKFTPVVLSTLFAFALAEPIRVRSPKGEPDSSQVWVDEVNYGGTGCPQGSATVNLSPDRKSFTVILDAYIASVGPGIAATESRKNCQLNIQLHYPGGFQYSVFSADYRGFVDLEKNVKATQKATYYFAGEQAQSSTATNFNGPRSGDYLTHDEIPFSSTVWSPCGRFSNLNINSQVRVENSANKQASGFLTTDSVDGKVTWVVGIQWKECPK